MSDARKATRWTGRVTLAACALALLGGVAAAPAPAAADDKLEASVMRGGLMYDMWYLVNRSGVPRDAHPSYPEDGKYRGRKGRDWRCKECHGWDYLGKDGAYGEGRHYTGIVGITGKMGADTAEIAEILKDDTHAMSDMLSDQDVTDLANFVSMGQVDTTKYFDADGKALGNAENGGRYFVTLCANCHGMDGKKITDIAPLGGLSRFNPPQVLHKILNGQPGENMPALRSLGEDVPKDLMTYLQTLPE